MREKHRVSSSSPLGWKLPPGMKASPEPPQRLNHELDHVPGPPNEAIVDRRRFISASPAKTHVNQAMMKVRARPGRVRGVRLRDRPDGLGTPAAVLMLERPRGWRPQRPAPQAFHW